MVEKNITKNKWNVHFYCLLVTIKPSPCVLMSWDLITRCTGWNKSPHPTHNTLSHHFSSIEGTIEHGRFHIITLRRLYLCPFNGPLIHDHFWMWPKYGAINIPVKVCYDPSLTIKGKFSPCVETVIFDMGIFFLWIRISHEFRVMSSE